MSPKVCLHIATSLNDKNVLNAAAVDIVDEVMTRPQCVTGIVCGVAFSFFHWFIVRVDTDKKTKTSRTSELQFSPSFYANSPSNSWINALACSPAPSPARNPDAHIIAENLSAAEGLVTPAHLSRTS